MGLPYHGPGRVTGYGDRPSTGGPAGWRALVYAAPPMRRFYTTYEAAHLLGVSLPTVVNWVKARRLKAHRTPGGHRRIAREELAGFMQRHGIPLPADLADAVESRRKALVVGEP